MTRQVRFGNFVREVQLDHKRVSYNVLSPEMSADAKGVESAQQPERLRLHTSEVFHILEPYVSERLKAQIQAVIPLAIYLVAFQILILRQDVADEIGRAHV